VAYVRYAILAFISVCLIAVALANRGDVTVSLLPAGLMDFVRFPESVNSVTVPLFIVMFAGIILGVLLGFVWEWLREHKHRASAAGHMRENRCLSREVARMRKGPGEDDDVLALLENTGSSR